MGSVANARQLDTLSLRRLLIDVEREAETGDDARFHTALEGLARTVAHLAGASLGGSYNGWPNYETWLLAVHLDNDPDLLGAVQKVVEEKRSEVGREPCPSEIRDGVDSLIGSGEFPHVTTELALAAVAAIDFAGLNDRLG